MGGRGASSGLKSAGKTGGGLGQPFRVPKFTDAEIKKMSRSQLESVATALYANEGIKNGLSLSEGTRRAKSLMSGNTSTQLRKYIKKHGK